MFICGSNKKKLCDEFDCEVTKTDNGITVSFSSDNKNKIEELHKMTDCCTTDCCTTDDKKPSCC